MGQRRKRGISAKPRSKSAVAKGSASAVSAGPGAPGNPEEGWDDETDPFGLINDVDLGEEVKRRAYIRSVCRARTNEGAFRHRIYGQDGADDSFG